MSDSETEYATKEQFIEAVRDNGAVVGDTEYFTEGNGSATSYKARTDDGEIEDVNKSDVEAAWDEHHNSDTTREQSAATRVPGERGGAVGRGCGRGLRVELTEEEGRTAH
jgi:hypothetical protein